MECELCGKPATKELRGPYHVISVCTQCLKEEVPAC